MRKAQDKGLSPGYLARRIVRAKQFIDTNYFASLDLNGISRSAHFSPFHFLRLFKKTYQKTPLSYLRSLRIDQARKLLETSDLSVREICFRVGFESDASFSLLFKKYLGRSPGAYRAWYRMKKKRSEEQPLFFIPGCYAKMYRVQDSNSQ